MTNHIASFDLAIVYSSIFQVTNKFGIQWLRRHLGKEYKVHEISFNDPYAIHIDTSLVLLKPGLALLNPERNFDQEQLFIKAGWKVKIGIQFH